jgi:hypothetical protein
MSREESQTTIYLTVNKIAVMYVTKDEVILAEDEDEATSSWIALIGHAGS